MEKTNLDYAVDDVLENLYKETRGAGVHTAVNRFHVCNDFVRDGEIRVMLSTSFLRQQSIFLQLFII